MVRAHELFRAVNSELHFQEVPTSLDLKKADDEQAVAPNLDCHFDYCELTSSMIRKKHFEDV